MGSGNPVEKRHTKRIKFSNPVQFQGKDSAQGGGCLSRDLSEGGIQITLYDFVPVHTVLNLQIELAREKMIDCLARVVWIEKHPTMLRYQAGLVFIPTDAFLKAKKEIYQLVKSQQT